MNPAQKKLSIIIVSYNTCEITLDCIDSIYKSKLNFTFEIIVVDNNSTDHSVFKLKQLYPQIRLIENTSNLLFAYANNQGAAIANSEYLLLLNSDTLIIEKELEKLLIYADKMDKTVAAFGPLIINADYSIQSEGYPLPGVWERITMAFKLMKFIKPAKLAVLLLPRGTPQISKLNREVGWVSGCCILVKKEIYDLIGGLNEYLGFYGEEVEFCWKLHKNGFSTHLVTEAKVVHLGGKSSNVKFLKDINFVLEGYAQLQKHTVGFRKAIVMSRIVLWSNYFKKWVSL
jgi:GT2 family glycosyltransferase